MEISLASSQDLLLTWHDQEFQFLIAAEHRLNILGYFTGLSVVSALCRVCIGTALIVQGIAELVFNTVTMCTSSFAWEKYHITLLESVSYIDHGLANIVRAVFEAVVPLGGFALLTYDQRYRYTYSSESSSKINILTLLMPKLKIKTL